MHRRVWMTGAALLTAVAVSAALFATAAGKNRPPDDRGRPSGVPASIELTADPLGIQCDAADASTITVRVTDGRGKPVPDGTSVFFDAVYGFVDPVVTATRRGEATTQAHLYPYAANYPGLPEVDVVVGPIRASIGIDCAPPPPPCGPDASPPCPTPTPCGVDFSPPCPEPTPVCGVQYSPPCATATPPFSCYPQSPPPCPPVPGPCWPQSPPCDGSTPLPSPTRTPSNTSVMFAVDADLTADGVQASRPGSVPLGQNFTVDVVLFGDVVPGYLAYQIEIDYDDTLFDPAGLPANWKEQPVLGVSGGTPLGTLLWPSGSLCDPSPTSNSVKQEDDSGRAALTMTCASVVFPEFSAYQGVLLTLVFRCETDGTGTLTPGDVDDAFLLDGEFNQYNDGVAHGTVTCGDGPVPPAPTVTPTPFPVPATPIPTATASTSGLRPFIIALTPTPTAAANTDASRRKRL